MFPQLKNFVDRASGNGQIVAFVLIGLFALIFLWLLGNLLTPFLITVVVFYLLDNLIVKLRDAPILRRTPPTMLVSIVVLLTLALLSLILMVLIPFAFEQLTDLLATIRTGLRDRNLDQNLAAIFAHLPIEVPPTLTTDLAETIRDFYRNSAQIQSLLNSGVLLTVTSVENIFLILVYSVVIPLAVFFLLKDKVAMRAWIRGLLPSRLTLSAAIWDRLNAKLGDYIRGKVIEIILLTSLCLIGFSFLGLNYAVLLSTIVGLAAIVPILGLIAVTIPIVLIAYLQWGFSDMFWYLLTFYTIIQLIDGYLIIPLLFGEVIDIHPLAILFGILFFGAWFGLWGVFFAIPLVILIQTMLLLIPQEFNQAKTSKAS